MVDAVTSHTVDILLDRCSNMQAQRDRAIVQRARFESEVWFAELLLKRVAELLVRLEPQSVHDSALRDTLYDEMREFIEIPRHDPERPVLPGGVDVPMASAGDIGQDGIGGNHVDI